MATPFTPSTVNDDTTINDTTLRKHVPNINGATYWASIEPYIRQGLALHVIPFIGQTLYDTTMALADTDASKQQLLDAIAYYGVVVAYPKMSSIIADAGVQVPGGGEGSSPISLWQYKTAYLDLTVTADKHLDRFMIGQDIPDTAEARMLLFDSVTEFQSFHNIHNSLRTYKSLVPYARKAYERYLAPYLSEVIDDLKTADTPQLKQLRYKAQLALSELTIYIAGPNLSILVDGDGMRTLSSSDALVGTAAAGYREALALVLQRSEQAGKTFLADLQSFIVLNIDDYSTLEATGRFTELNESVHTVETDSAVGFFFN